MPDPVPSGPSPPWSADYKRGLRDLILKHQAEAEHERLARPCPYCYAPAPMQTVPCPSCTRRLPAPTAYEKWRWVGWPTIRFVLAFGGCLWMIAEEPQSGFVFALISGIAITVFFAQIDSNRINEMRMVRRAEETVESMEQSEIKGQSQRP